MPPTSPRTSSTTSRGATSATRRAWRPAAAPADESAGPAPKRLARQASHSSTAVQCCPSVCEQWQPIGQITAFWRGSYRRDTAGQPATKFDVPGRNVSGTLSLSVSTFTKPSYLVTAPALNDHSWSRAGGKRMDFLSSRISLVARPTGLKLILILTEIGA